MTQSEGYRWNPKINLGIFPLFMILLLSGCGGQSNKEIRRVAPVPVEIALVEQGPITESIQVTGRIDPFYSSSTGD